MNIATVRTAVRTLLAGTVTEYPDAVVDRAVSQAVAAISRFYPKESVYLKQFEEDVTAESFVANHGTAVILGGTSNASIRFGSETVTKSPDDGTTYARNTDYEMNYINGTITALAAGAMADDTAHLIDYKFDGTLLKILPSLTNPISISRIMRRHHDQIPVEWDSWETWGDFLRILTEGDNSQSHLIDEDILDIYYYAFHTDPGASASASYPRYFDELALIGISGYVLLIEALEREQSAITNMASAVTDIGTTTSTAFTAIDTAVTNARTHLTSAVAQFASAVTELNKVDAANGPIDDAEADLAGVAANLTSAETALAEVTTHVKGASNSAKSALDLVAITDIESALDKIAAELQSATRNADDYLNTGDAKIDNVNAGNDVAGETRRYAEAKISMAQSYAQEGVARVQQMGLLVNQANSRLGMADAFISEASGRLTESQVRIKVADGQLSIAATHQVTASHLITEGTALIAAANREVEIATAYVTAISQRLARGTGLQTAAKMDLEVAVQFNREADLRLSSFFNSLSTKGQYGTNPVVVSAKQYATGTRFA